MIGRGLRGSAGKDECLLLDHSGNVVRFAESFSDVFFNGLSELDAGERLDKEVRKDDPLKEGKPCPQCGNKPMGRRCIRCGFEPVKLSTVDHEEGEATEIDILQGPHKYASSERALFDAIATYCRAKAEARGGGNPKGATAHKYRDITGRWPPKHFLFEAAPYTPPSDALRGKLRALDIAFAKGRTGGRK